MKAQSVAKAATQQARTQEMNSRTEYLRGLLKTQQERLDADLRAMDERRRQALGESEEQLSQELQNIMAALT